MKDEKPFKVVQEYIKLTQEDIAEFLDVSVRTVSSWSTDKFTNKKIKSNPPEKEEKDRVDKIVEKGFLSEARMAGFIARLKHLGYDVSDYDNENLTRDNFTELLREYLAEALNKADSDIYIKKKPSKDITILKFKKPENYFSQTLYNDQNEIIFDFDQNNDYEKINEMHRILVECPGGQGKSVFLSKLLNDATENDEYEFVFFIDLPELISLTKKRIPPLTDKSAYYILTYLSSVYKDFPRFAAQLTDDEDFPKTLLLLDGLNELLALSDFSAIRAIGDELSYISAKWPATIIMTTRPSDERVNFLASYHICSISGTPENKFEEIKRENPDAPEEIVSLAKIPLYYNAFSELKGKNISSKYELLFNMYLKKYKQSSTSFEGFVSYFVFAPLAIKAIMLDSNKNRLSRDDIKSFAKKEFKNMNLDKFIRLAAVECNIPCPIIVDYDIDIVTSIFLHQSPIELTSKNTFKIHDEIRDFLLAFCYTVIRKVFRESLDEGQYTYIKDLDFKINLRDNGCDLLKESLGINSGKDLYKLKDEYTVLNDCPLNPQTTLFAYTLFMLSDNLTLGSSALAPFHEILSTFTTRICRLVKQGNFENCLKDSNSIVDEEQKIRCRLLDVMSKHIEFYRKSRRELDGLKLIEICEKIKPNYSSIKHQKAKLLFSMYESHVKNGTEFDLESIGFSDYAQLYEEGVNLLEEAVETDNFDFSNILLAVLHSTPPPFLYNDPKISVEIDYVKAFNLYCSLIFADKKFIIKRVTYAIRKAVGLLLNSYVIFNPDFEVYEEVNPKNCVVLGDRNILNLDRNTLKIAKHLMQLVDGVNATSLNFYRSVIALYYDQDYTAAKRFLDLETDQYLKRIFLHYAFKEKTDLEALYDKLRKEMNAPENDSIEKTSFVYLYCDAKLLELSFNKERKAFFDKFEEALPETTKRIITGNTIN